MLVCGCDEAGRGAGAAEVYVAAVILDPERPIAGLADSKKLTPKRRKVLAEQVRLHARSWCIATASLEEIERFNVLHATLRAVVRAVEGLSVTPDLVLMDGNHIPRLRIPTEAVIKGDATVPAISAASILAKVARDEAMINYHRQYPQYGFDVHKGYLTRDHLEILNRIGPCPIHRQSFAPIRNVHLFT